MTQPSIPQAPPAELLRSPAAALIGQLAAASNLRQGLLRFRARVGVGRLFPVEAVSSEEGSFAGLIAAAKAARKAAGAPEPAPRTPTVC